MYLHCRIENPYLGSLSTSAQSLYATLLFTDKYTMCFSIFTPLRVWFALPVKASNLTSLVNSYFSFKVQGKYHPISASNSISHHKFMLGHSGPCKRN